MLNYVNFIYQLLWSWKKLLLLVHWFYRWLFKCNSFGVGKSCYY